MIASKTLARAIRYRRSGRAESVYHDVGVDTHRRMSVMECRVEGRVQQGSGECSRAEIRDQSRFQANSNQVYFAADNFPAPTQWLVVEVLLYVHRNRIFIRGGSPSRLSHSF